MTAEQDAIGRAITRLAQATVDQPTESWQAVLDDLAPFVDPAIVNDISLAYKFVVALRYRTGAADTTKGRDDYMQDATMFLWQALRASGGLTEPPRRPTE